MILFNLLYFKIIIYKSEITSNKGKAACHLGFGCFFRSNSQGYPQK
ncbi:hypothetical protein PROSTU_01596 [Providencia stuartii ATCC 25827]|uniref:Uncharacterized protein n=1 Tax=Providencia stuartii ATCC 25827 TaxID=471874 RepID=A0AA86YQK9_PROST|nr:hypothetical protein PROSTU_01596 [Providencia stuartii ATCC 25827]